MKVIVFGSVNMDLVVTTPKLPAAGETLHGHAFFTAPGGKGANQAVAAAKLGAETVMIGRVGHDDFAASLKSNLADNGVDVTHVRTDRSVSSGVALIQVDDAADNTIVIVAGANGNVGSEDVAALAGVIEAGDILLLQLEVPMTAVIGAAKVAAEKGATIFLDPAPARTLPEELIALANLITPNETEAGILTGVEVLDQASAERAIARLHDLGAKQVLLKSGSNGAFWSAGDSIRHIQPYKVEAIDTVAAGDATNGGIAAGLCSGLAIGEALSWGMAAGALAVTKRGAQEAMPILDELIALIDDRPLG